jgi:hypothetical protein|tara:strand:- start:1333 stop:1539 length:207 start_codon:yes stop_codon:yes gene_type:complete
MEFNLSDKIFDSLNMNLLDIKDVKEFIRLLKEETIDINKTENLRGFAVQNERFTKLIDKLSGDKLNGI